MSHNGFRRIALAQGCLPAAQAGTDAENWPTTGGPQPHDRTAARPGEPTEPAAARAVSDAHDPGDNG